MRLPKSVANPTLGPGNSQKNQAVRRVRIEIRLEERFVLRSSLTKTLTFRRLKIGLSEGSKRSRELAFRSAKPDYLPKSPYITPILAGIATNEGRKCPLRARPAIPRVDFFVSASLSKWAYIATSVAARPAIAREQGR